MRIFRLPLLFRLLFPGAIFRYNKDPGKVVYLTFDDGPTPGVTGTIVEVLEKEGIMATFFCSGEAAENNPGLLATIRNSRSGIANHGYRHIKGWKTGYREYIGNARKGSEITGSSLFRPPFGSLTPRQFFQIRKEHRVVFWDLILYDFDPSFKPSEIVRLLKRKIRPGSVIVLHDNSNSSSPLFLGDLVRSVKEMGYTFGNLAEEAGM